MLHAHGTLAVGMLDGSTIREENEMLDLTSEEAVALHWALCKERDRRKFEIEGGRMVRGAIDGFLASAAEKTWIMLRDVHGMEVPR